ncbi:MAG: bacteriohemerythrin [Nevskia sp.]|nr:bacteriohemerythrin [Nevskia sp.]
MSNWSAEMDVGDDWMNRQHRWLLAVAGCYTQALCRNAPQRELVEVLEEVADYARDHFREEEALMAACNYPDLASHRRAHQQLLARITILLLELRNGVFGVEESIRQFLGHSLTAHIKDQDTQYRPYVQTLLAA